MLLKASRDLVITWFGNYTTEVKMDTDPPSSKRSKVTLTNIWTMAPPPLTVLH